MFSKACPFDILNIKPDADDAEIKTAHKKAVLKYHPDKSGTTDTAKYFRLVQASYELLNDRITYDKFLKVCKIELGIEIDSARAEPTGGLAKPTNLWADADEQLYYWEQKRKLKERQKERFERWKGMQEETPRERAKREREEKRQQDKIQKGMVQVWIMGKDRRMKQKWVTKEEAAKY